MGQATVQGSRTVMAVRTAGAARTPGPGRRAAGPRRALAVFALLVSLWSLIAALVAFPQTVPVPAANPAGTARPVPPAPIPARPETVLCSACGVAAPPWRPAGLSPLMEEQDKPGALEVSPRAIAASAHEAPPDRRIGAVQAFVDPSAAAYAGVGWERVNFDWNALYPQSLDQWNRFAVPDGMLAREQADGREVVGILEGLPHWATDPRGLPRGLYLPADDPRNLWGSFVWRTVQRYRTRIHDWIIWNEPDVWDPNARGFSWPGSVDNFVRLQSVAYQQIKRLDPSLVVHLAATTYWWDAAFGRPLYFDRVLDAIARDPNARANHWYFDVASAHVYNVPDDVEHILQLDRAAMRAHGINKPIWLDETGAAPTRDGPWSMQPPPPQNIASAQEQAAFVAQASVLAIAGGAQRISFYKLTDPPNLARSDYPSGLVRPDGSARPALAALRATTHALAGWTGATDLGTHGTTRAVAVDRGARGGTLALWDEGAAPVTATVTLPVLAHATARWVAAHVTVVADDDTRVPVHPVVSAGRATLRIPLAASTCASEGYCHIGGAPVLVVAPAMPQLVAE